MEEYAALHGKGTLKFTPEAPPVEPLPIDIRRVKPGFEVLQSALPGSPDLSDVMSSVEAPPTTTSFIGPVDNNVTSPPDVSGAVGHSHVMAFMKSGRTIYNRNGGLVSGTISMQAFWSNLGTGVDQPAENPSNPRVVYDQYINRWIVTCTCYGTSNAWLLVGMSATFDPTGGWSLYAIQINSGQHTGHYMDTPGLGIDPNNVVITGNVRARSSQVFQHSDVYVINKGRLFLSLPLILGVDYTIIHSPCADVGVNNTFMPCHTFDQSPPTAVNYIIDQGWFDPGDPTLRFVRISPIVGIGALANVDCLNDENFVHVACYNFSKADADQPNSCFPIHANTTALTSSGVVRNGRIYFAHHVGNVPGACPNATVFNLATRSEIRWYEVDPSEIVVPGIPRQQGAIGHSSLAYYFPSIAVNQDECVMIGFSGSDSSTPPGAFYTNRLSIDPPGTMRSVSVLKAGDDTYRRTMNTSPPRNRWGEVSSTVVDPADGKTLWTFQEYARPEVGGDCAIDNTGRWGTWWGAVRCSINCGTCVGDANNDNKVNARDVGTFVRCYMGVDALAPGCGCCDLDQDSLVTSADISAFVNSLLNIGIGDPSDACP